MTEQEYVRLTNYQKVRDALHILRDVLPPDKLAKEFREAVIALSQVERKLGAGPFISEA